MTVTTVVTSSLAVSVPVVGLSPTHALWSTPLPCHVKAPCCRGVARRGTLSVGTSHPVSPKGSKSLGSTLILAGEHAGEYASAMSSAPRVGVLAASRTP